MSHNGLLSYCDLFVVPRHGGDSLIASQRSPGQNSSHGSYLEEDVMRAVSCPELMALEVKLCEERQVQKKLDKDCSTLLKPNLKQDVQDVQVMRCRDIATGHKSGSNLGA